MANLYDGAACTVMHAGLLTPEIKVQKGVRQGCILSPLLFNICLDYVLNQSITKNNGLTLNYIENQKLADLEYADDICLMSRSILEMQAMVSTLQSKSENVGLITNVKKTREMRVGKAVTRPERLYLNNTAIDHVSEFTYLGSIVSSNGKAENDIKSRIAKARQAFNMLGRVWNSQHIKLKTKMRILNSNVSQYCYMPVKLGQFQRNCSLRSKRLLMAV